ncbi:MAG: zf-TFIIB domain-containing protein [Elusimicrobia bacterium]|nr:zf-TFIIB domain-containing protein [Elusimicrobiota bacterium]
MADCPKCPYVGLDEVTTEQGVRVDECPECGGRWFDAGELEAASPDAAKLSAAVNDEADSKPSDRPCARCAGTMVNRPLLNRFLRVDACPRCRGFWVDKNELPLINKLLSGG